MLAESPDAIFLPLWFLLRCGLIVPAMLVALGATLAFFAVQLRLTHDGGTHDRPGRTGDRLWLSGGALLLDTSLHQALHME
ncbi:hypothetical protein [Streptomyces mirabilis]|jgi:hypothetical protein|uniref:hypothetical protein n=1 Tax=Streptomyces mirabilis TaxID=68239 RepID=UPI0033BF89F7